ncbi:HIT domain-containing protein [soil metagenome]
MSIDRIWAGWRLAYIEAAGSTAQPEDEAGEGSLFERLLASDEPDERTYILWRGERCFAVLNAYPYNNGHLMVLPYRSAGELEELDGDETTELWQAVTDAVVAIKAAYRPDGVNVGLNLGRAAGAGVPGHLHVHCLPRWAGDTNFMTAVAETRVLPEALDETWRKLTAVWPT